MLLKCFEYFFFRTKQYHFLFLTKVPLFLHFHCPHLIIRFSPFLPNASCSHRKMPFIIFGKLFHFMMWPNEGVQKVRKKVRISPKIFLVWGGKKKVRKKCESPPLSATSFHYIFREKKLCLRSVRKHIFFFEVFKKNNDSR